MRTTCELLAPAGSMEKLKVAIRYGADAVYLGGNRFSLRARAGNFSEDQIVDAVKFAHSKDVKVYVTVNIFAHNRDLDTAKEHMIFLRDSGVDALIISDPGLIRIAKGVAPEIPLHLSTQANTTNISSAMFWQDQGLKRVNLARELGIKEIRTIRQGTDLELEVFVHGALCISYSGRCMLSLYLTGRDANQGHCAHPCRYSYRLEESKRKGVFYPVEEDERGLYFFNSKDLCLIRRLPEIMEAGVDSIKIEGRMKGLYYLAGVVRLYRAALDFLENSEKKGDVVIPEELVKEIGNFGSRGFTENFFNSYPEREDMLYKGPEIDQTWIPAGLILEDSHSDTVTIKVTSIVRVGDTLDYMHRAVLESSFMVRDIISEEGLSIQQASGGMVVSIKTEMECGSKGFKWNADSLLRRKPPERK